MRERREREKDRGEGGGALCKMGCKSVMQTSYLPKLKEIFLGVKILTRSCCKVCRFVSVILWLENIVVYEL